jgi:YbbR domain-containing protein
MIRWLLENVGLILLALIVAVVVWIAQEWERDPIVEDDYDQPISVVVQNQPSGTFLVEGWQQEVRVRLRAPQSVWDQLRPADFRARLDLSPNLSPLEPGEYDVGVQVSFDVEPAVLLGVEPEFIRIELEAIRQRAVPVVVQVRDEPDLGYQAGEPVYTATVKVEGPASQVDRVLQVESSISLVGARAPVEEQVSLMPVDADGKRVSAVTLQPDRVQVRIPVRQQPNFKEMAVIVEILGQPAADYRVTNVSYTPSVVNVIGSPVVLGDLPGVLNTVPISIEGRTENVVERLALELPPGVSVVDPNELAVQVTIQIEPLPGSVTVTRTLTYQGLQPGLMPIASPAVVEVILSGPRPRLSALLPEDVRVILDLSDLRLGDEGQLEPVVVPPEGTTAESIIPSVIQIRIVRQPTPTPLP